MPRSDKVQNPRDIAGRFSFRVIDAYFERAANTGIGNDHRRRGVFFEEDENPLATAGSVRMSLSTENQRSMGPGSHPWSRTIATTALAANSPFTSERDLWVIESKIERLPRERRGHSR